MTTSPASGVARNRLGRLLLCALAGVLATAPLAAQAGEGAPVVAVATQGLSFGPLIPGVPEAVSVRDAARRAEVVLEGQGTVDVMLVLPRALVSSGGGTIPLRFGAEDGALVATASGEPMLLDPHFSTRVRLTGGPAPARLLLGGTAVPAREQPAGQYSTTIVVIISAAGT